MKRDSFTDRELIDAYSSSVSIPEAAEKLGVNRKTLWKWLKALGVDTDRKTYQEHERKDWGECAKWLRKNKDNPLPKSAKELASISGLSRSAWDSYIYRRKLMYRKSLYKYLHSYIASHGSYPNGRDKNQSFKMEVDFYTHSAVITLEDGSTFKIATKAPSGYRR